jgi:hypothetical protein
MPGGHSSLSANEDKDGIIWTLFLQGDGQWEPQQGTLVAFDALTLKQLWSDAGPISLRPRSGLCEFSNRSGARTDSIISSAFAPY